MSTLVDISHHYPVLRASALFNVCASITLVERTPKDSSSDIRVK